MEREGQQKKSSRKNHASKNLDLIFHSRFKHFCIWAERKLHENEERKSSKLNSFAYYILSVVISRWRFQPFFCAHIFSTIACNLSGSGICVYIPAHIFLGARYDAANMCSKNISILPSKWEYRKRKREKKTEDESDRKKKVCHVKEPRRNVN